MMTEESKGIREFWQNSPGLRGWMLSLDHKKIGMMYLAGMSLLLLVAGFAGLLVRFNLLVGTNHQADMIGAFQRLTHFHSSSLFFLFAIISIPAILGHLVIPSQIGTSKMAYPLLNRVSFYAWVKGVFSLLIAWIAGGPASLLDVSSWGTFSVSIFFSAFAVFFGVLATVTLSINIITTIHTCRAPGLLWKNLPMVSWSLYVSSILLLLTSPIILSGMLLGVSHTLTGTLFSATQGGDALVASQLLSFFKGPALFAAIIPAIGIISDLISNFSRKPLAGYHSMVVSLFALAVLSFAGWNSTTPSDGGSVVTASIYSFSALLVLFPLSNIFYCWISTLSKGKVFFNTPMILALGSAVVLIVATIAYAAFGHMAIGMVLHNTLYSTGLIHLYATCSLLALLAGIHFWWPKFVGKAYDELWAVFGSAFLISGCLVSFVAMLFSGSHGMLQISPEVGDIRGLVGMIPGGGLFIIIGLGMIGGNLIYALKKGQPLPENLWLSSGLEWQTLSPLPDANLSDSTVKDQNQSSDDIALETP